MARSDPERHDRGMTQTTTSEMPPGGADTGPRRLVRTPDGKVAGVAAGIGHYLGVDPTIVRISFVLLAFAGGIGILLYLACWLVMPKGEIAAGGDARGVDPWTVGALVALVLGVALLFGWHGLGDGVQVAAGLGLVGVGIWLLVRDGPPERRVRARRRRSATARPALPRRPRPVPRPTRPGRHRAPRTASRRRWPPRGRGCGSGRTRPASRPDHGRRAEPPLDRRRARDRGHALRLVRRLGERRAGGRAGRRRSRARRSPPSSDALPGCSWSAGSSPARCSRPPRSSRSSTTGSARRRSPRPSLAELESRYAYGIGDYTLDLRDVALEGETRRVEVELGIGALTVLVPDDAALVVDAHVDGGELRLPDGSAVDGWDERARYAVGTAADGALVIDLELGFGEAEVRRGQ